MKILQKMKLSGKITLIITTLLILSFGIVGFITYMIASNALAESIETNLFNSAKDAAMIFSDKCETMKTEARLIAQQSEMTSMNWTKQKAALRSIIDSMGYMSAAVADTRGNATFTTNKTADVSERQYFKDAMAGQTTLTDPIMSVADNKLVIVVASPITDSNGKIAGVLMISREANTFTDLVNTIAVGKTGYAYLINKSGIVIAHPEIDKVINQHNFIEEAKEDTSLRALSEVNQKMINGESGHGEYTYQGIYKTTSYTPVPNTNWFIGLTAPKSEFFSAMTTLLLTILLTTVAFIVICVVLLLAIIRSIIIRPIEKLVGISEKIAAGDVNVTVEATTQDEIGILSASYQKIIASAKAQAGIVEQISTGDLTVEVPVRSDNDILSIRLNELIMRNNESLGNITTAADQVALGAKQLSDSSVLLSQGATEQASSLQQLAASIEEISEKTLRNAEGAGEANKLAEQAKANAIEGDKKMNDMLQSMDDINASSNSISKIIKVIDDIAFQTNILALNAAVEAARAGQHGKGFAVVAEEVRTLAARSANAANETTELIESSINKVHTGTKIAHETATSLNKIVGDITKAAGLVGSIAEASMEQSSEISQIKQALTQINTVVQTNSATAEESAASSEELSAQAVTMKDQVKRYKLKPVGTENMSESENTRIPARGSTHGRTLEKTGLLQAKARISLGESDFGKY